MAQKEEPEWEIVDSIPGEKPPSKRPSPEPPKRQSRRALWIGIGIGALAVAILPPLRALATALVQGLARAWWLLIILVAYWLWRRARR